MVMAASHPPQLAVFLLTRSAHVRQMQIKLGPLTIIRSHLCTILEE